MILGIDLGNFNIKTSTGLTFKAIYSLEDSPDILKDSPTIEWQGTKYYISKGTFDTELNKSKKDTMPLYLYALAMSTKVDVLDVVVGLPINQFKENKAEMEKKYKGTFEFKVNGKLRSITVKRVKCFPECIGAFYSLDTTYDEQDFILVDVGGRTTNIALFQDGEHVTSTSLAHGMLNILDKVRKSLNEEHTLDLTIEDAERILTKGLIVDGEDADLKVKDEEIEKLLDAVFNELKLNFPYRTTQIVVCGGGSKYVYNALNERHFKVGMIEDYLFANAIGFKTVGEAIWQ